MILQVPEVASSSSGTACLLWTQPDPTIDVMRTSEKAAFDELVAWSTRNGASLSLEIYQSETTGFSFRSAAGRGNDGQAVVTCPFVTTLSYFNALVNGPYATSSEGEGAGHDPAFPARFMESVPPHVIGRFYLMQQFLLGSRSYWYPYIKTLPQPDRVASWALPAFWPAEDIEFLENTNAHAAIDEIQANVKEEFKQARKLLRAEDFPGWQDYSRLLYNWAFCIFTSRSFRPSLVLSDQTKEKIWKLLPPSRDLDDFSILQPLFDIANHSPTAGIVWDTKSDPTACQLICKDSTGPGEQVFNNYGQKSNGELLLGYGFILPATDEFHNEYVHVRKREDLAGGQPGGGRTPNEKQKKDFLVSLRPMNDPSSLAGRSRQLISDPNFQIRPCFAHFEDSLLWDIASMVMEEGEWKTIEALVAHKSAGTREASSFVEHLKVVIGEPTDPGVEGLVARIKEVLSEKLRYDYEKLVAAESRNEHGQGVGEEAAEWSQPANPNQVLAVAYRYRCRVVLEAAIRSLAEK